MARFGSGVRTELESVLRALTPSEVYVVGDARVLELHGPPCGGSVSVVRPGEACKTPDDLLGLFDGFAEAQLDRDAVVVGFGGGAALDLAGFAAAIWMRGVRWVAVPTTLLAQVDAAHGGKTGLNLPDGKNLVGAFHPPSEVVADSDYLATLPEAEVRAGLAEVVKHAVIGAPALLDRAGRSDPPSFVEEAARVKLAIVARDPYERGERRLLNLGHTLGHALETATRHRVRHGDAVAVGLRAACAMAERHCGFR
ncbi:MAG: 3-dehydroquinate synthase, partial [Planctomycetota bacterium]